MSDSDDTTWIASGLSQRGYFRLDFRLIWGIVACNFVLLGFPGTTCSEMMGAQHVSEKLDYDTPK